MLQFLTITIVKIVNAYVKNRNLRNLLKERIQNFRYLIFKNYKIIYWFNKEKNWIEIVDVFDTRQNPPKISLYQTSFQICILYRQYTKMLLAFRL